MQPNEGRLQTAEHILSHILEHRNPPARVVIAKFAEDSGLLEVTSIEDLRLTNLPQLEKAVNDIAARHLGVKVSIRKRAEAENEFDLSRVPASVAEVRIVEIVDFDTTPCKDPHVRNTEEIGVFKLLSVKRTGKDRYRFIFHVE